MIKRYRFASFAWFWFTCAVFGQHQTQTLTEPYVGGAIPYTVEIKEVSFPSTPIPNIHSIAAAEWQGQWVFLGGRTNGLHGMTGMNAFDSAYENREVWVVDPGSKQSWHKSLEDSPASGLSQDVIDSLSAVNMQYYLEQSHWLIVGGYGFKRSVGDHVTYDTLTVIDLPGLVDWVKADAGMEKTMVSELIDQVKDSYFQVTGGGLERINDEYQLIFGQNYSGRYRPFFDGVYTKQVRRFQIDLSGALTVPETSKLPTAQNEAFRRRDLNVVTILERTDPNLFSERVMVLSGVFTPETGVWTAPVLIGPDGSVVMSDPLADSTLKQGFQVYHSSKVSLYNRVTSEAHVLLFGGLSVLERDLETGAFIRDDQVPFTNQCSLVVRDANTQISQYWLPTRFPDIRSDGKELRFGTNAEFFLSEDVPKLHPKVVDLAAIESPTVIGHILGGLISDAGNNGNTGSSGRIFEVIIIPTISKPQLTITKTPSLQLDWEPIIGYADLIEESIDLNSWQELTESLTDTSILLLPEPGEVHFYRRLTAKATTP
jgi:hypothetical protein